MSIKSHAFGRVTLTGPDADKFKNQVTYGKPKIAAVESLHRGIKMAERFKKEGSVRLTIEKRKVSP